jgi:hypothetical protein
LYELPVHDVDSRPFAMCPNCGTFVRVRPRWRRRWTAGVVAGLMVGAVALLAASGCNDGGQTAEQTARTGPGYIGAFRLPEGKIGESSFAWGGTALAFNPTNNSLFLVGHDHQQAVAEIQIPASVVNSGNLKDLPTAKVLQPFVKVTARIPNHTLEGVVKIGGLMLVGGRLLGTLYEYYDADVNAVQSHFVLDSLTLATAKAGGLYTVGTLGGGFVGGYMTVVPADLRDELGASYVTGQAALCIIGRTSSGPALFGFDPTELGSTPAPVKPYVFYPLKNPLAKIDARNPYFNGNTEIKGVVFVPGTRSVLFFGSHGTGDVGYGQPEQFNDPNRGSKGWHSVNGEYAYQVWAYDVDDFVAVKYGVKKPWEIKPSQVKTFDFPVNHPAKRLGGVAIDPATGRLYVSQLWTGGGDSLPLIHVFQTGTDASFELAASDSRSDR